jgi:SagB-type dehydrogenase family enzyme
MEGPAGIGAAYQEATKYARGRPVAQEAAWATPPPVYKTYDQYLQVVGLPPAATEGGRALWELLAHRRSRREFADRALTMQELSQLLWAVQGVTAQEQGFEFRTAASAGALYPNETYVIGRRLEGMMEGVYHYLVREHALGMLAEGDFSTEIAEACVGQRWLTQAPAVFVWGAVVARSAWKYQNRAYRYLYLDAGALGAQLQLACEALGLVSCNVGAFFDDEVAQLVGLDGRSEVVVYLTAVGHPRSEGWAP